MEVNQVTVIVERSNRSSFRSSFQDETWRRYNRQMREEYEEEMERVEQIRRMQSVFNREKNMRAGEKMTQVLIISTSSGMIGTGRQILLQTWNGLLSSSPEAGGADVLNPENQPSIAEHST